MTDDDVIKMLRDERTKLVNRIADLETENIKMREAVDVALNAIDEWHHARKCEMNHLNCIADELLNAITKAV